MSILTHPCSAENFTLVLSSNVDPPYQTYQNGKISGVSWDALSCVASRMQFGMKVNLAPWNRARLSLLNGSSDGLFTVLADPSMENIGVLSAPLALEKWAWHELSGQKNPTPTPETSSNQRLGVLMGSNAMLWLKSEGYQIESAISSLPQLVSMLENRRVDLVLADTDAFQLAAKSVALDDHKIHRHFLRYVPLGVYFSGKFISQRPNFLPTFNRSLGPCVTEKEALSRWEIEKLTKTFDREIRPHLSDSILLQAMRDSNEKHAQFSQKQITDLDIVWAAEVNGESLRSGGLVESVENTEASALLRTIVTEHEDLVSELFAFDRYGLNFAQAAPTTDFWQGDEDKYLKTVSGQTESLHFGEIKYDESARTFQVQVTAPLLDNKGHFGGAITVGFDIQTALSR